IMLIVYAHPNKKGFCGYTLKSLKKELNRTKKNYRVLDLYEKNYDPVLKDAEHYTSGGSFISKENKMLQDLIQKDPKLIFIFPVWWNNMPAILKGFFDRVFIKNFAFRYKNHFPKPLLQGKAAIFCSCGSPKIIQFLFNKNRAQKIIKKDILKFCGLKAKTFTTGSAFLLNEKQKRKIDQKIKKGLKYLN
ncbi:MAG: flavodoxin family protein, partial [Candidatus Moranbacteria bacterium]|nr:flavodoxin family protein [Candidatus Moranbacteria bacterium]